MDARASAARVVSAQRTQRMAAHAGLSRSRFLGYRLAMSGRSGSWQKLPGAASLSVRVQAAARGGRGFAREFGARMQYLQERGVPTHSIGTNYLTEGCTGDDVMELQRYLQETGYFFKREGPTGYFGELTRQAVAAWQVDNELLGTGSFGDAARERYLHLREAQLPVTEVARGQNRSSSVGMPPAPPAAAPSFMGLPWGAPKASTVAIIAAVALCITQLPGFKNWMAFEKEARAWRKLERELAPLMASQNTMPRRRRVPNGLPVNQNTPGVGARQPAPAQQQQQARGGPPPPLMDVESRPAAPRRGDVGEVSERPLASDRPSSGLRKGTFSGPDKVFDRSAAPASPRGGASGGNPTAGNPSATASHRTGSSPAGGSASVSGLGAKPTGEGVSSVGAFGSYKAAPAESSGGPSSKSRNYFGSDGPINATGGATGAGTASGSGMGSGGAKAPAAFGSYKPPRTAPNGNDAQ